MKYLPRTPLLFALVTLGVLVLLIVDLSWGAVPISLSSVLEVLTGKADDSSTAYIVWHFRMPKALTALLGGMGVALSGLMLQSLFRNPLADTSILGISSGAGVGVALYTMAGACGLGALGASHWGVAVSACLGASSVLLIVSVVAARLGDVLSVLLVGVMVGFLASSIVSVLQFFSDEQSLRNYLLWSFGSVSTTTWGQLAIMAPVLLMSFVLALLLPKHLNALNLGESYARSLGLRVERMRLALVVLTSVMAGIITAFAGPIAFLGMAVPHFVRLVFRTSDHRVLLPATMLSGALLLLLCDVLTQMPGRQFVLPINALTSLLGAPVVILVILRGQAKRSTFS